MLKTTISLIAAAAVLVSFSIPVASQSFKENLKKGGSAVKLGSTKEEVVANCQQMQKDGLLSPKKNTSQDGLRATKLPTRTLETINKCRLVLKATKMKAVKATKDKTMNSNAVKVPRPMGNRF